MARYNYGEALDILEALPKLLYEARRLRGLGYRRAGAQMGVAYSILWHVEHGSLPNFENLRKIIEWIGDDQYGPVP